jgi:hypothetical protein
MSSFEWHRLFPQFGSITHFGQIVQQRKPDFDLFGFSLLNKRKRRGALIRYFLGMGGQQEVV